MHKNGQGLLKPPVTFLVLCSYYDGKGEARRMDFEWVYRTYFKDVFLYICSLSADESIAEEITQEAFVKALNALDRFDGSRNIRAWLFTIARNTYSTHSRRRKRFAGNIPSEALSDPQPDLTEKLADEETALRLHQFLHQMKEPYREVFSLRVFGELPFEKNRPALGEKPGLGPGRLLPCQNANQRIYGGIGT